MQLSRQQLNSMALADTVAIPPTFPELGGLSYCKQAAGHSVADDRNARDVVVVEHRISPKLIISRMFFANTVAAVFIPANPSNVDLTKGKWLLGTEIEQLRAMAENCDQPILGIAYVHERASTLMQVEIGMTAAESAEYYPPLPDNRSVNHYDFRSTTCTGGGCPSEQNPGKDNQYRSFADFDPNSQGDVGHRSTYRPCT